MVKFSEMGLKKEIVNALDAMGLKEVFPIQETSMPHILNGEDVIGQAHTGTGKTLAFSIPIIQKTDPSSREITALIVVPTRELAVQITEQINKFSRYTGIKSIAIYGGTSMMAQFSALKWRKQIVVATPGRLIDFIERKAIRLNHVKFMVLDEADRMFDMGFIRDIEFILRNVPKDRQTLLFSATMPKDIVKLSEKYMKHPVKILLDTDELSVDLIAQTYLVVEENKKFEHLSEVLNVIKGKVLVFCSTKHRTKKLARDLCMKGFRAVAIHGNLSQNQRQEALDSFREGRSHILVATDVAARGLDIKNIEQIINFDVPMDPLMYFHRIGRTARAGEAGKALTLVSQHEYDDFQKILHHTEVVIKQINKEVGIKVVPRDEYYSRVQSRRLSQPKDFNKRRGFRNRFRSH